MSSLRTKHVDSLPDEGRETSNTYFSYGGPTTLDTPEATSPASLKRHGRKKDVQSHSSYSDRGDTELSTIPARSRIILDPSGLMLVTSPISLPVGGHAGHTSAVPTFVSYDCLTGAPSNRLLGRRPCRSRGVHQPRSRLRNLVIIVASLFIVALVAVIFTAVYFGQGFESRSRQ